MILISHRGNISGKNLERENHPDYIEEAIKCGFHVEVDVWYVDGKFKLGHDKPTYDFPFELLEKYSTKLWIHCKNIEAIVQMNLIDKTGIYLNYFWHQKDDVTLTSKGYIWAYPNKQPVDNSIAVLPEMYSEKVDRCVGVCSDQIQDYV